MKTRWLLLISAAINLALLIAVAKALRHEPSTLPVTDDHEFQETVVSVVPDVETTSVQWAETNVATFDWSQVATQDFRDYRDRLLAMNCPARTMRVIVLSEINEKYERQMQAALAHLQSRFWDLIVEGPQKMETVCKEAAEAIQDERESVIQEVLGKEKPDDVEVAADKAHQLESRRAFLAWLPEEKRDELIALEDKFGERRTELWKAGRENSSTAGSKEEQRAKTKALEQEFADERKQILTPEENEEYDLRNSSASHWASSAAGFEPTEEEWRAVARLQKQRDDAWEELNSKKPTTPAEQKARDEEIKKLNDQLAQVRAAALGPERAALFERSTDRSYKQVREITQHYGLDDAVAVQVYEFQREALKQVNSLRADTSLDDAVRNDALAAIQQETERTLQQTLGAKAFSTYRKNDNGWFSEFGRQ